MSDTGWRALLKAEPEAVGTIASTLPDLAAVRRRWDQRLGELARTMDANLETLAAQLRVAQLPSTRPRLEATAEGVAANRAELLAILSDLGIKPGKPGKRPASGSRTDIGDAPLLEGYPQILRDWAWPETHENEEALALVEAGLEGVGLGQGVVLGCGAGRLTADLARRAGTERLFAVDIDPLPLAVLVRMLSGSRTQLHELPRRPRAPRDAARAWELRPPGPLPVEIVPLLADGRDPGLRDGVFDAVICPWYLDQVAGTVSEALDVAYNLLRPGGQLLHYGPLIHRADREPAEQLTLAELAEAFETKGFSVQYEHSAWLSYLRSPLSGGARELEVHVLRGERDPGAPRDLSPPPAWWSDDRAPVPRPPGLGAVRPPNAIVAEVIRLLNGRRSVRDIALQLRKKLKVKGDLTADTRETIRELHRLTSG